MPELPVNPYIAPDDEPKRDAFRSLIWSVTRLAMVTQHHAPESTFQYVNTVLLHTPMYTGGDRLTALYGAHYELAAYAQNLLGVDSGLQVPVEPARCSSPECVVNHESEAVILEAAVRGEAAAIANVCKATVRGAKDLDPVGGIPVNGEGALVYLFMGLLQRLHKVLESQLPSGGDPSLN